MQRDSRGFFTKRTHTHLYRRYWNVGRWVDGSETVSGWQVVGCCVVGGEQKELHLSTAFQNSIKNLLFSVREHWKLWARVCWLSMGQHDLHTLQLRPCLRYILHVRCTFTLRIFSNNFTFSLCGWYFFLQSHVRYCVFCVCACVCVGVACVCTILNDFAEGVDLMCGGC